MTFIGYLAEKISPPNSRRNLFETTRGVFAVSLSRMFLRACLISPVPGGKGRKGFVLGNNYTKFGSENNYVKFCLEIVPESALNYIINYVIITRKCPSHDIKLNLNSAIQSFCY